MTDALVLYHNPNSRGRIAHFMLEELGVPYRVELLDFEAGEHKRPAFLKLNPMGKLPTLLHGDTVITEAAAICTYLADAFPAAGLAPALGDRRRGTYLRWMFFGPSCLEPALTDKAHNRPEIPARAAGWGTYQDVLASLESALAKGPYILGDTFSAVDVYLGSAVGWGLMVKSLEPRPIFERYSARIAERPAFQRVLAQSAKFAEQLKARSAAPSAAP